MRTAVDLVRRLCAGEKVTARCHDWAVERLDLATIPATPPDTTSPARAVEVRSSPSLLPEVATPTEFEAVAEAIGPASIGEAVACCSGVEPTVTAIDCFVAAGFDTVHLHRRSESSLFMSN